MRFMKLENIKNKRYTRIYEDEEATVDKINEYYIEMSRGRARSVTEFFDVEPNLTFKQFNCYINSLDNDIDNII